MADRTSRLADIEALTDGVRWRWGMICVGTILLVLGRSLGLSELTPLIVVVFLAVGGFANLTLVRLLQLGSWRVWLTYVYCLIDVLLVSIAVVYLGPGGTIAGFLLVILPCVLRPGRALGLFALFTASVAFPIAASLHGLLSDGIFELPSSVLLDLVLLITIASALMTVHTSLFGRIAVVLSMIKQATEGSLEPRTAGHRDDLLGQLERSLNTMLEDVASTIEMVHHVADEVAVLSDLFARCASSAGESSMQAASMATGLAQELRDLQSVSDAGLTESTELAQEARNLLSRAESEEKDALAFEEAVQRGRDSIVRTSETALAISADVKRATGIVNAVGGLSRQIGSSALSIAKVARHTHVLALNAAIEAARAEEHGKEFAVVADQVRTLAGEAGRSARDVGNLISEVQAGIMVAENTLLAGDEKINDIEVIVGEARSALTALRSGASNAADLVSTTVDASKSQAKRAASLAVKMSQIATKNTRWISDVTKTSEVMLTQMTTLNDLVQANQRLVDLAERLRKQVARYSTSRSERTSPTE